MFIAVCRMLEVLFKNVIWIIERYVLIDMEQPGILSSKWLSALKIKLKRKF